ncbi:MAG: ATP-binding protein [Rhodocyclales bacterium]|nr:ATP-binding protein [Rhodocyclales bacterium]
MQAQARPALQIRGEVQGGDVVLRFHDNGPGIESQHLAHIFDPFFTTKPVGRGTGLGLSISYGIVERHGGQLLAGNHVAGGAEFVLRLPLAPSTGKPLAA